MGSAECTAGFDGRGVASVGHINELNRSFWNRYSSLYIYIYFFISMSECQSRCSPETHEGPTVSCPFVLFSSLLEEPAPMFIHVNVGRDTAHAVRTALGHLHFNLR